MELTPRKQAILTAVVEAHIKTGEPIGSKMLCNILDFNLSSATLRNEMSDLCELGLLEQPHTSAGRVPSVLGYRMYVNSLMQNRNLSNSQKQNIDNSLKSLPTDPELILSAGAQALSELTGLTAVSATVAGNSTHIKHIKIIPLAKRMLLFVLVTDNGITKNRIASSEFDLTEKDINLLNSIISSKILGKNVSEFNRVFLQTIISSFSEAINLIPVLWSIFELVDEVAQSKIYLKGQSNLFNSNFDSGDAVKIIDMFSNTESVISIFSTLNKPINILFGSAPLISLNRTPCMIIANFGFGSTAGKIGVIGPTRISYENIIPGIEYFAQSIGKKIRTALSNMED